jgi:hypothetical protein
MRNAGAFTTGRGHGDGSVLEQLPKLDLEQWQVALLFSDPAD